MPRIGLVAEGPTDVAVIDNLLSGILDDKNFKVRQLVPQVIQGSLRPEDMSNWTVVLEYIGSSDFRNVVEQLDYVVVQIDTDPVELNVPASLTPDAERDYVVAILREKIGVEFYESQSAKILFAVSVKSIECWLLPLYYPNTHAQRSKTVNCLDALQSSVQKGNTKVPTTGFKNYRLYDDLSRPYVKRKNVETHYQYNPSLKAFVEQCSLFGVGTPLP